jgi:hypothetical protein
MKREDYTDDAICHAMGIGSFIPSRANQVIRTIFKPSFHPEVCITIESNQLIVHALKTMLWREQAPARLPEFCQSCEITNAQFDTVAKSFAQTLDHLETTNMVAIDGMFLATVYCSDASEVLQFSGHTCQSPMSNYARIVLDLAYEVSTNVFVRKRVADCGRYVGAPYTSVAEPQLPDVTQIGVLGQPDDREAYFKMLEPHASRDQKP